MVFNYTDKQLNELNHGKNVYSVNDEYANRDENQTYTIVNKEDNNLLENEKNMITTSDGQEFRVIATKSHRGTGFDGLAVAPIVNGEPDYKSIAVIAAGTDPGSPTKIDISSALVERDISLSPQYLVADRFVKEIIDDPRYEVSQLSGYSQGSYMLKVGAKYHIPTTTFNAWFTYLSLSNEEKAFIDKNPAMFIDYRRKSDNVVVINDFNHPEWFNKSFLKMPDTIY